MNWVYPTIRFSRHSKNDEYCHAYEKHYHLRLFNIWLNKWGIARAVPHRNLRQAIRYWHPHRLTMEYNSPIYAWLWWNFELHIILRLVLASRFVILHPRTWGIWFHFVKTEWKWRGVEYWHRY